ncbi:unnamed protein product [Candida verbasci]|uniref:Uncharacterized protein n=1 Tax=Candida verbasci TaxID=1227364 RepID=A0A9W4TTC1_9ASCO|nr:unnamed protein product [Candida verbasci]
MEVVLKYNKEKYNNKKRSKIVKLNYSPKKKRRNSGNTDKGDINEILANLTTYNDENSFEEVETEWFKSYLLVNDRLHFLKELYKSIELIKKRKLSGDLNIKRNPSLLLEDSENEETNDEQEDEDTNDIQKISIKPNAKKNKSKMKIKKPAKREKEKVEQLSTDVNENSGVNTEVKSDTNEPQSTPVPNGITRRQRQRRVQFNV